MLQHSGNVYLNNVFVWCNTQARLWKLDTHVLSGNIKEGRGFPGISLYNPIKSPGSPRSHQDTDQWGIDGCKGTAMWMSVCGAFAGVTGCKSVGEWKERRIERWLSRKGKWMVWNWMDCLCVGHVRLSDEGWNELNAALLCFWWSFFFFCFLFKGFCLTVRRYTRRHLCSFLPLHFFSFLTRWGWTACCPPSGLALTLCLTRFSLRITQCARPRGSAMD